MLPRVCPPLLALLLAVLPAITAAASDPPAQPLTQTPQGEAENAPEGEDAEPLPVPPVPPRINEGQAYGRCLDLLATDPSGADVLAATLAATDGREAATHCHALAQVALGNPASGAALLDRLAAGSSTPPASRAVIYGQADQAWTMAGDLPRALASADAALALSPDDADLRVERAVAALSLQRYAPAADDLSHALELDPHRADALILRATAWRNLGRLDLAAADIEAAARLDPDDPDLLLERGIIRQRSGDLAGAKADWGRVSELAPDSSSADLAEQNLALLQAGPRQ